jgi:hypothetical protein
VQRQQQQTPGQSPSVASNKARQMGGVATPFAGAPPPVSSPGRQSALSQYAGGPVGQYGGPLYSQANSRNYAPSTTYNPGYQEQPAVSRRYLSEGELLEPQGLQEGGGRGQGGQIVGGVGPSTSAGHIQVVQGIMMLLASMFGVLRSWRGHLRDLFTCGKLKGAKILSQGTTIMDHTTILLTLIPSLLQTLPPLSTPILMLSRLDTSYSSQWSSTWAPPSNPVAHVPHLLDIQVAQWSHQDM